MLEEFYQYIDQYGLNTTKIIALVVIASVAMLFAVREMFSWFMKTGQVARQFKVISKRLEQIESQLAIVTLAIDQETEGAEKLKAQPEPAKSRFHIHL